MIKVLVVDDTTEMRHLLVEILSSDPQIEVVGSAPNTYMALEKIKSLNPDVLTLDVRMTQMEGMSFLRRIMESNPLPVVMVSSMGSDGADITLQALELGAIDYMAKPSKDKQTELQNYAREFINKVKIASKARIRPSPESLPNRNLSSVNPTLPEVPKALGQAEMIIALGASTGGTEALKDVLCHLPQSTPGIVITQHIPIAFSKPFSERLNANSAMTIHQALDGQPILAGHGYVAPGDRHLEVVREGSHYICRLRDTDPVNRHKPSVEVMFNSVAKNVGKHAIGVLLTGMGDDGADAMGAMKNSGAVTIAQDEASSVVWGMPGEAVKRGHASEVLPLSKIAERILYLVQKHR